eukprot:GHUV01020013.1.p1 GENE.GHUV01020013.1~~GHUV01020013.1.p1  ORF type:complete len:149 (+),score=28.17 GHUV01020013.1:633-1079(+)
MVNQIVAKQRTLYSNPPACILAILCTFRIRAKQMLPTVAATVSVMQNPPLEGNTFLANLLNAKPVHGVNPYTGATYHVNPAQIASAVLATREALAAKLARNLEVKVSDANIDVMRTHLETHTYVSGSNNERRPSYRHYRQSNKQHQHM